ncbi:MAG: leucine--tRNA ligase [Candidatus Korarchaeota archaeon NZ13-K]|nr:MAG: leucine--tRNA ligase [Candidatus Korarchaeota archaeon NZ13-K]
MSTEDLVRRIREIEKKWQARWEESRIFEADPDRSTRKFYLTVAYPYPNSPQHIGHGRTYSLTDAYARFKRMQGYNVLLPMAFHYTGTPILAMSKRLREGDAELMNLFLEVYGIPKNVLKELEDPLKMARYFHEEIKRGMKLMGYSIDWRREFTTVDPAYNRFISWQFRKLHEKGYLTKGRHPVGWCPRCDNAVGQHDTLGDVEPEIAEVVLIKFEGDSIILPTATYRPETVFGVTNIWVNPELDYLIIEVDRERWVVSEEAFQKLRFQGFNAREVGRVKGRELIGRYFRNPATGGEVPALPADFVRADYGTGIVMSVPGHAPYDFLALRDLMKRPEVLRKYHLDEGLISKIAPISIIEVEGFSELPARDAVESLGVRDQLDPRAEEATQLVYSKEYHLGRMKSNTGAYAGLPVKEAKERVKEDLIRDGKAHIFFEIVNSPVYCRCGAKVLVRVVEDQWFIDYSNPEWKELAREALRGMRIVPKELRREFEEAIDWMREKACARKSGLGTRLPFDPDWIIESLSDSTIYMAFYTISKYINSGEVDPGSLDDEVFDHVFLGMGDPEDIARRKGLSAESLRMMREEFLYWYPLDSRHSGRDLIWNHLTFFIFNHVAIFPRELWPRQIVVNGSVTMEGKKMSKSLGNIIPIGQAVEMFGADPIRLSVLGSAELSSDADFSPIVAVSTLKRLLRILDLAQRFKDFEKELVIGDLWDRWIITALRSHVREVTEAMEECRTREAIHHVIYLLLNEVEDYLEIKGSEVNGSLMKFLLGVWARLLSPFAPHTAEEVWEILGEEGFVSKARWPSPDEMPEYREAEISYRLLLNVIDDVRSVTSTGISGSKLYVYVASSWKYELFRRVDELRTELGLDPRRIIPELMREDAFRERAKSVSEIVKQLSSGGWPWLPDREMERSVLESARDYLRRRLGMEVVVEDEDNPSYDPRGRAGRALPGKPAIYIE